MTDSTGVDDLLTAGTKIKHPTLGIGKIVSRTTDIARVYFKDDREPVPDRRIKQFKMPGAPIEPVAEHDDAELDNLPPWSDGRFQQFKTPLTLDASGKKFLQHFPAGLSDPAFLIQELDYKRAAHRRFTLDFLPQATHWIANGDAPALARGLDLVYGDPKAPAHGPETRLNLLYQRIEEPAFFDAVKAGDNQTIQWIQALLDFLDEDNEAGFHRYLEALRTLPTRSGGARVDTWTAATWLPFIASPARYIVVKPTIVRAFASMLAYEIHYRADVNYKTYRAINDMALALQEKLQRSDMNLSGRSLDLIDVQSFMWTVERYGNFSA